MEAAAQGIARGGDETSLKGLVRVNAPPALSLAFVIEELARVPTVYPGLDIDIASDLRSISLDRHQADIAVRLGRPLDGDFIAKPMGRMDFGFYGTPRICAQIEAGMEPVFISFDEENADMPDATWLARNYPKARVSFRANNHVGQATAAKAGAGLALIPHYVGRRERTLQLCKMPVEPASREIWILTRRQDRNNQPIRTVADFLMESFSNNRQLFEA
ncbi:hypothetical protein GCM10008066_24170 [Oxalicibacterium faecigallinarum]|uniref:LysR substrate-binding domain-containing protein n=2 Tax=Oxalicibacterium faecigallinarum TaxID=573741 RepID=A0A8J3AZC9_9BURK|nr:hypothetical protein GCM10008066_24170 [Oxalicibacterium faecigallinarum]